MKLLLFPLLLFIVVYPVYGQLSDATGLVYRFDVETGGYTFEVKTVSNFDVTDYEFDKDEKRLTLFIKSSLENNLSEIIIPQPLLDGNFTFYLNDIELDPKIQSNDNVSFITLEFNGTGNNKLDIFATEVFAGTEDTLEIPVTNESQPNGGGCLIATTTFGSELAPQVQLLREIRDNQLLNTESGMSFMTGFNQLYYSFSPHIADLEREHPAFKEMVKIGITPLLSTLSIMQHAESDSEVLGYGIGVILMNIGMYLAAPAIVIMRFRQWVF